jgi:hypothetical protein
MAGRFREKSELKKGSSGSGEDAGEGGNLDDLVKVERRTDNFVKRR